MIAALDSRVAARRRAAPARLELRGTFGAIASSHWLASAVGMAVLERGGNAFDATCAAGFALQVVEPHMNGPGGEVTAVFWDATHGAPLVLCGQGVTPAAATIDRLRDLGHRLVPGVGVLAATVPGAFGGWLRLLRDFGTWRLPDVLEFAIGYAERGYPATGELVSAVQRSAPFLERWPGSAALYLPPPEAGSLLRNEALAATYRRILREARHRVREEEIERARARFYDGFVAEEIDAFVQDESGLLRYEDLSGWHATLEAPATVEYRGTTVCKTGAWGQGPAGLQQLALLRGFDVAELSESEFVHVVTECTKLALADRDACYGDADVPLDRLLSEEYAAERRSSIGEDASAELRPGIGRLPALVESDRETETREPPCGDTVHLDVADSFGNLVSATPSGGWLQSSPVIPALGWPLGTRAQSLWLEEGLPSSLRPLSRPRTTLSPGLVLRGGEPWLAWGTPGGDQQEQWSVHVLLRHLERGLSLQEAIDAPEWHTDHLIASFHPRGVRRRSLSLEPGVDPAVADDLRRRGHVLTDAAGPAYSRVDAVSRTGGQLVAAASARCGTPGWAAAR